jgi:hypothetical protein
VVTAVTGTGGKIEGVLTSSDVYDSCTIHTGTKERQVLFTWNDLDDEEAYEDTDGDGEYTAEEPYTDTDGNGEWTGADWTSETPYLVIPGTSLETLRLRHNRGTTNDVNWKPLNGHNIRFYVEEVRYVDANGGVVTLLNKPSAPTNLCAWASFTNALTPTDDNGVVSVTLTMADKTNMIYLGMVAYDFSVYNEPVVVASASLKAPSALVPKGAIHAAEETDPRVAGILNTGKDASVPKMEIVNPIDSDKNGKIDDPATQQNGLIGTEFVYDNAVPGVLKIPVRVRLTPDTAEVRAQFQDRMRVRISAIDDSHAASPKVQLVWDNAFPNEATAGKGVYANGLWLTQATFTKLPRNNTDFGKKTVTVSLLDANGQVALEKTVDLEVFFPRDEFNHPFNDDMDGQTFFAESELTSPTDKSRRANWITGSIVTEPDGTKKSKRELGAKSPNWMVYWMQACGSQTKVRYSEEESCAPVIRWFSMGWPNHTWPGTFPGVDKDFDGHIDTSDDENDWGPQTTPQGQPKGHIPDDNKNNILDVPDLDLVSEDYDSDGELDDRNDEADLDAAYIKDWGAWMNVNGQLAPFPQGKSVVELARAITNNVSPLPSLVSVSGIDNFYGLVLHEGQHVADAKWMFANCGTLDPHFLPGVDTDSDGLPDQLEVQRNLKPATDFTCGVYPPGCGRDYTGVDMCDAEASALSAEVQAQDGLRLKDWACPGKQHGHDLPQVNGYGEINPYDD